MDLLKKMEIYCAYQERCHQEIISKMFELKIPFEDRDEIVVSLINNNFLNEERFAKAYARGKHSIKKWGKIRIINELKIRNISAYNIKTGLKEIDDAAYIDCFEALSEKQWETTFEKNIQKKKKKVADFLFRKGYEKELIYGFINSLK